MTSTSTMDTEGSAAQAIRIAEAGADLVRLTAQGVREATNLTAIKEAMRAHGCQVPLVADIHFNPRAALEAAARVEKVRINPGNFADPGRTFKKLNYTDAEYAAERARITEALRPLIEICRAHDTALRIGVNHGSLSDRIMSRYGDTPRRHDRERYGISARMPRTGFRAYSGVDQSLQCRRDGGDRQARGRSHGCRGMHFPLHLGVTEAGNGEDGRVKSAVGIGTLLAEGLGDTIRVSLSEEPEAELPVARMITDHIARIAGAPPSMDPRRRAAIHSCPCDALPSPLR